MKKFKTSLFTFLTFTLLISSCSSPKDELIEKFNSIDKRYSLAMSYDGCFDNITSKNVDTSSRSANQKIVLATLIQNFNLLNEDINYLNNINKSDVNIEILNKYNSKISSLLSEHIKIYRLVFVEGCNKNQDYWGKLSLEGSEKDILKQAYENKTQKSIIIKEKNNLVQMRFKKVMMFSSDEKTSEEINITSPSDFELIPMKM